MGKRRRAPQAPIKRAEESLSSPTNVAPAGVDASAIRRPAKTLAETTLTCDLLPLKSGDRRWQDLSAGRGGEATLALRRRFLRQPASSWLHVAFASHRGAGKTSELHRLAKELEQRYFCIYLESNVELDPYTIDGDDLLMVLARAVESTMREARMALPRELLEKVANWFADITESKGWLERATLDFGTGAEASAQVPFFAKLFAKLTTLLKHESERRRQVKSTLRQYPGTLLDSVNAVLDAAAAVLRKRGKELLVILDNLDRYPPKVIDELLVQGADRIANLHCYLILTPPISLIYRPESELIETRFPCELMNAVKLRDPAGSYQKPIDPGRDLMLSALALRVDLARLIPEEATRERIIAASGGAIRDCIEYVQEASLLASGEYLDMADVDRVLVRRVQRLRDRINANGWHNVLERIARTKQLSADPMCLDVLYHRLVLKYNEAGWYDIHPLVAEVPEIRDRLHDIETIAR